MSDGRLPPESASETLAMLVPVELPKSLPLKLSDEASAPDCARITLQVIAGPHEGQTFSYTEHDTMFAGRLSRAHLRLEKDLHFSRHHFRLELNPPTCYLMDLHSRNGTFVNGKRVTDCFLQDGDVVSGGKTQMVVSIYEPKGTPSKAAPNTTVPRSAVVRPTRRVPVAPSPVTSSPNNATVILDEQDVPPITNDETAPRIPGYQIHEQIGAGDLGTVYRATQMSSAKSCAMKVIFPAARTDEKAIQTFLREATILGQLTHPNIVSLIEVGAVGEDVFLATEYVETVDWKRVVKKSSPQQRIHLACGLMCQILGALEYAHSRTLVHRDIKPANILISRNGGKLSGKLADFGLAKQYTTAGMSNVTRDGDVIGSLPFMSPDQFLNSRDARPACDIYSSGATLYWLLTGREPIDMDSHPCKFLAILETAPTEIQSYNPSIPDQLAELVHRALEKTPEKRFESAGEMQKQLKPFSRGESS